MAEQQSQSSFSNLLLESEEFFLIESHRPQPNFNHTRHSHVPKQLWLTSKGHFENQVALGFLIFFHVSQIVVQFFFFFSVIEQPIFAMPSW